MNYNDEDRAPIDFKTNKKTVHNNNGLVVVLIVLLVALIGLLIFLINLSTIETVDSTKIEIGLYTSDIKVEDKKTCSATSEAIEDASKIKLNYKKSSEKFYKGNSSDLLNDDGTIKEVDDKDKIPGVDLVIEGITNNIYAYVEYAAEGEDCDGIKYTASQAKDGKVIIPFTSHSKSSASVYIYAADENCEKLLKHYDVVLPMYNSLSENSRCNAVDAKDTEYCSEFSYEKYNESDFDKLGEVQKQKIKVNLPAIIIITILFIAAGAGIWFWLRQ